MKLTIEVQDEKADFLMELLRNFSFVKLKETSSEKARIIADIKSAVEEVKAYKRGEIQLRDAQAVLDEL